MKKRQYLLYGMIFLLLFVLFGCGEQGEKLGKDEYYIYYMKKDFSELVKEVYQAEADASKTENLVKELIEAMKRPIEDNSIHCALGNDCILVDYQITDRKMTLNFDVNYGTLIGVEETLHRAAIVKTLTQVKGVDSIEFLVDSQPLMLNKTAVGYMTGDDFIETIGGSGTSKKTTVSMYYANESGTKLVEVPKEIVYDSKVPLGKLMVQELLKGPATEKDSKYGKLQKTIPEGTKLNGMTIRDNICYVDFSREFTNILPNISTEVTIYSVVNLLAELPNVNKVQFTIDGEQISKFGNIDFSQAFERNLDVLVQTDRAKNKTGAATNNSTLGFVIEEDGTVELKKADELQEKEKDKQRKKEEANLDILDE